MTVIVVIVVSVVTIDFLGQKILDSPEKERIVCRVMQSLAQALGLDVNLKPVEIDPYEGLTGQDFAKAVLESSDFRRYIVGGLLAGDLPAAVMIRLMDHGWGKPPDRIEHTGKDGGAIVTRVERVLVQPQDFVESLEASYSDRGPNITH